MILDPKIRFAEERYPPKVRDYVLDALDRQELSSIGPYNKKASDFLLNLCRSQAAFLMPSCTAALEMACLLIDLKQGDEVIMPSYSFVSTANAVALRGAKPVFVDIELDTLNIDLDLVERAVTPKTKAVMAVHYAGLSCDVNRLKIFCEENNIFLIEDVAHGVNAKFDGQILGSFGDLSCFSFHHTKNISTGEGGALCVNNPELVARAEIIREKGTDRSRFLRGEVDRYSWRDLGSSFLVSELTAAAAWAQLEELELSTSKRLKCFDAYHKAFGGKAYFARPRISDSQAHTAHFYWTLFEHPKISRQQLISELWASGLQASIHYEPLHLCPAARRFARFEGDLPNTVEANQKILRFPCWNGVEARIDEVVDVIHQSLQRLRLVE